MAQRTVRARRPSTPLEASALGRAAVVAVALLPLWAAIGAVLGWWG